MGPWVLRPWAFNLGPWALGPSYGGVWLYYSLLFPGVAGLFFPGVAAAAKDDSGAASDDHVDQGLQTSASTDDSAMASADNSQATPLATPGNNRPATPVE